MKMGFVACPSERSERGVGERGRERRGEGSKAGSDGQCGIGKFGSRSEFEETGRSAVKHGVARDQGTRLMSLY